MDRLLLVVAASFLCNSPSLAANEDRVFGGIRYTLVSYHENGFDGAKPVVWGDRYDQFSDENMAIEERSVDDWLARSSSALETGLGIGVAPLFGSHGVYRTSSNPGKPTYVVLGFISDELIADEVGPVDSWDDSGLSYGFGVNNSSFNFEYMMSVDQGNYDISAIGMSFISEF